MKNDSASAGISAIRHVMGKASRVPRHAIVTGAAWASRIVVAVIQLLSIRLLVADLGLEQYAMFALLTGLLGWYMLADLGLGVSVQNKISESRAHAMAYDAYILAAGMCAIVLLVISVIGLHIVSPYIAPRFLKGFTNHSDAEKTANFFISGAIFIGAGLGTIAYKIWYAEQRGHLANIFPALASLVGFAGILVIDKIGGSDRLYLSLVAFYMPAAILPIACLLIQAGGRVRSYAGIRRSDLKEILIRAFKFWLYTVIGTVVLQVDYIVISQTLQPGEIAVYALTTRVFGFLMFFYAAMLAALWPSFSESIARNDWDYVRRHIRMCIRFGMGFVCASTLGLLFAMPLIIDIVAPGQNVKIPILLMLLSGLYQLIRVWTDVHAVTLQSMNSLRPLWTLVPAQAVVCVGLQYLLAPIYGVNGIMIGLIGSFISTVGWGLPLAVSKHFRGSRSGTTGT